MPRKRVRSGSAYAVGTVTGPVSRTSAHRQRLAWRACSTRAALRPGRPDAGLRLVDAADLPAALAEALAGGPAVAPLPPAPLERQQALAMLTPDEPLRARHRRRRLHLGLHRADPKAWCCPADAVAASVRATHERLGGPGDWVLALPAHYVAGLMVLARAALGGTRALPAAPDLADLPAVASATERPPLPVPGADPAGPGPPAAPRWPAPWPRFDAVLRRRRPAAAGAGWPRRPRPASGSSPPTG